MGVKKEKAAVSKIEFHPLDKSRWKDFEKLFGERGACGGCWCMAWRLKQKDFEIQKGNGNKKAMKKIVDKNEIPGIIAYVNNEPAGWCSFAPREKFIKLENSKVLARIDDKPVWSITCFFIAKHFRRKGLSTKLLEGVIKFCKNKKVNILEAYPVEPYSENIPAVFAWTGIPSAFEKAGFKVAERRSPKRPIMRYYL
jgi:GNAT superfamily N-acetyltransferase